MKPTPLIPYNELPNLENSTLIETTEILKAVIKAREELFLLKSACDRIRNPTMLINVLPLLEARDSSEIENIVTTNDKLFRLVNASNQKSDAATLEAYHSGKALSAAAELLSSNRPININTAIEIVRIIRAAYVDVRAHGVVLQSAHTGEVKYTPPDNREVILQKLRNWEEFINGEDDLDPLVRLSMAHYQFEAIHPFSDGNGRTGRILNVLLLVQYGFLDYPVLSMSRYILREKNSYYELLRGVTFDNNWQDWILFMLCGIEQTAKWTTNKINQISSLFNETTHTIFRDCQKIYSDKLMALLFSQPYFRLTDFLGIWDANRQTTAKYIQKLISLGIINESHRDTEGKVYINIKLHDILTTD